MNFTSNFEEFAKEQGECLFLIEGINEQMSEACSVDPYKISKSVAKKITELKNEKRSLYVGIVTTFGGSDTPDINVFGELIDINEEYISLDPKTVTINDGISVTGTHFESGTLIADDVYAMWIAKKI